MEKTILQLGVSYGHLFTSQYKTDDALDVMIGVWGQQIGHFSYARLCRAIKKATEKHKDTVNLPQFRECCKLTTNESLDRQYIAERATKKLEAIPTEEQKLESLKVKNFEMGKMFNGLGVDKSKKKKKTKDLGRLNYNEAELLKELEDHKNKGE